MSSNYYSIITNNGLIKEAEAGQIGGNPINLTEIAVGDGNGSYYEPTSEAAGLVNELYRANLTSSVLDANNPNQLIIEGVIPEEAGPFYIREVGIFDSDGELFAIGKYPETFKSNYESGSGKRLYIRMIIAFVSTPNVEVILSENINFDPNFEANLNIELANRLKISENLADLNDAGQARNNLEVYSKDYLNSKIGINHIINGSFDIWQRGSSFVDVSNGSYSADRWKHEHNLSSGVYNASRSTDIPTLAQAGRCFNYSHSIDCTTIEDAIADGEYFLFSQNIEGYYFVPIAQKQITLSFWVKATKTGTYCVAFRNSAFDKSYVAEYNINSADTWEYKTITIEPSPSDGTWNYTTGQGLRVGFTLGGGLTYQTSTTNSWLDGNYFSTPNQVNALGTVGNSFKICGVQLEEGNIATNFEYRHFIQELALSQRYYCSSQVQDGTNLEEFYVLPVSAAAQINRQTVPFPVLMRATPTMSVVRTSGTANTGTFAEINARGFRKAFGGGQYEYAEYTWTADAEL